MGDAVQMFRAQYELESVSGTHASRAIASIEASVPPLCGRLTATMVSSPMPT
jgi:hypothetical protein